MSVSTVDVETEGRIMAAGQGAPHTPVRLYIDDEFRTETTVGDEGNWSFIEESVLPPGDHHLRVDQIADAAGTVSGRAEVTFSVAAPLAESDSPLPVVAAPGPRVPDGQPAPPSAELAAVPSPRPQPPTPSGPAVSPPAGAAAPPGVASTAANPARTSDPAGERPTAEPDNPGSPSRDRGATAVPPADTVTIRRGDNLWLIARRVYGAGMRYTTIYAANRDQIRDPDIIYPGQVFAIPPPDPAWGARSSRWAPDSRSGWRRSPVIPISARLPANNARPRMAAASPID